MTNTIKVEHFTAKDYDAYVLISLSLNDKRSSSVHETLSQFINTYHPYKLTSDEESAIHSQR